MKLKPLTEPGCRIAGCLERVICVSCHRCKSHCCGKRTWGKK